MQTRAVIQPATRRPTGRTSQSPRGAPGGPVRWFWRAATALVFLVFLAGGLLSGYLFYETVRTVVASLPLQAGPSLPFVDAYSPAASSDPANPAPVVVPAQEPQVGLDRMERIN